MQDKDSIMLTHRLEIENVWEDDALVAIIDQRNQRKQCAVADKQYDKFLFIPCLLQYK